ncbi:hypothetical protein EJ08DRAFT_662542 [Tothia fuscella]|uniref:NUC153 domain-containing protein n=1 Tax=Tothia fuscella TaxID=1048955 RepID=A0A9P4TX67_9PEZI|nr:hypothetical protein EJ08DRAFT_662542 [Tothia fuscella]
MPYPKQKAPKGRSTTEFTNSDPRFKSLETDPRFRLPSKKNTHTKLDSRFARVLKDDSFSNKASVDKYGRKVEKGAGKKELKRLYQLEDEDEDEVEDELDDDDEIEAELKRVGRRHDPAREGGFESSSSEEGDSDIDDEEEEEDIEDAEIDEDAGTVPMGEISSRIAAVNLDWSNIRAVDLMAVASSFAPVGGKIVNVTVYPSQFGRERMEREEIEGPPLEVLFSRSKSSKPTSDDEESEEESEEDSESEDERVKRDLLQEDKGEEVNSTALRKYEKEKLLYYYAIITCSCPEVGKKLYEDMDGKEYLRSANRFDLRFVPDEVSFDDEKPRDSCASVPPNYKPIEFVTEALTHSKVTLSWDADDTRRKEVQKRAFSRKEIDENDLQAYIGSASSSEGEESEEEPLANEDDDTMSKTSKTTVKKQARRDVLRAALGLGSEPATSKSRKGEKGPVGDMQVSFTPGLSATSGATNSVFENDPRDIEETSLEKYVRRERERKARRKEKFKAKRQGLDLDEVDATADAAAEEVEEVNEDKGFEDPFFTDPMQAEKDAKKTRKAEKARQRAEREEQEKLSATKKAELELLLAGDGQEDSLRHFNMREIAKKEKEKGKRGKKNKNKRKEVDLEEETREDGDEFRVDVRDERFARLFDSHEFAIDPTNPRFKRTKGMKAFMEEARRKRGVDGEGEDGGEERSSKKVRMEGMEESGGGDLMGLVEKVKKKSKESQWVGTSYCVVFVLFCKDFRIFSHSQWNRMRLKFLLHRQEENGGGGNLIESKNVRSLSLYFELLSGLGDLLSYNKHLHHRKHHPPAIPLKTSHPIRYHHRSQSPPLSITIDITKRITIDIPTVMSRTNPQTAVASAIANDHPDAIGLLDLPREFRDMIYKAALSSEGPLRRTHHDRRNESLGDLLAVNHQIKDEAHGYLYQNNTFKFTTSSYEAAEFIQAHPNMKFLYLNANMLPESSLSDPQGGDFNRTNKIFQNVASRMEDSQVKFNNLYYHILNQTGGRIAYTIGYNHYCVLEGQADTFCKDTCAEIFSCIHGELLDSIIAAQRSGTVPSFGDGVGPQFVAALKALCSLTFGLELSGEMGGLRLRAKAEYKVIGGVIRLVTRFRVCGGEGTA